MKLHKNNNNEIIDVDPALEYETIQTNDPGDEDGSTI